MRAVLPGRKAHVVFVGEELVVERQADCVGACRGNELDVFARDIVVFELLPEFGGIFFAGKLAKHLVNETRRVGSLETEHIALGVEPVAEVRTADVELRSVRLDEIGPLDFYELASFGVRNGRKKSRGGHD